MFQPLHRRQLHLAFGLRALFLFIALLALPLTWVRREVDRIAERRALLCEVSRDLQQARGRYQSWAAYAPVVLVRTRDDISWLRAALGDQQQRCVVLPYAQHDDRTRRFSELFPETTLRCLDRKGLTSAGNAAGPSR